MITDAPVAASKIEHWRRRMGLGAGCVLFFFLITHLANHSLGLASLDAMDAGRYWFWGLGEAVSARCSSTARSSCIRCL